MSKIKIIKPTPHTHKALERLAQHLGVSLLTEGLTVAIRCGTRTKVITEQSKSTRYGRALAFLIHIAQAGEKFGGYGRTMDEMRSVTQYKGPPPERGLAGWEDVALMSLVPEEHRHRARKKA